MLLAVVSAVEARDGDVERAVRRGRHGADAVYAVGNGAATVFQVAVGRLPAAAAEEDFGVVAHVGQVVGGLEIATGLLGDISKERRRKGKRL